MSSDYDAVSQDTLPKKSKKSTRNENDILERLCTALREPIAINAPPIPLMPAAALPQQNEQDEISHLTALIGSALRNLPKEQRLTYGLDILQQILNKRV